MSNGVTFQPNVTGGAGSTSGDRVGGSAMAVVRRVFPGAPTTTERVAGSSTDARARGATHLDIRAT